MPKELSPESIYLLVSLLHRFRQDSHFEIKVEDIVKEHYSTRNTVNNLLKKLDSEGCLETEKTRNYRGKGRGPTRYRFTEKMEKRLSWIVPQDRRQAEWLRGYISQKGWYSHIPSSIWDHDYVKSFLAEAMTWSESADTREQCRNLKAAWQSWDKRDKNKRTQKFSEGSYTISSDARNQLERLAKDGNYSFSGVIEELLLNAQEIKHLQKQLARVLKEKDYGRSVNCNFLSTFFADDMLMAKAELVTQQLEKRNSYEKSSSKEKLGKAKGAIIEKTAELLEVKSKLQALQAEADTLRAENRKLQKLALEAQKELDQYLAE